MRLARQLDDLIRVESKPRLFIGPPNRVAKPYVFANNPCAAGGQRTFEMGSPPLVISPRSNVELEVRGELAHAVLRSKRALWRAYLTQRHVTSLHLVDEGETTLERLENVSDGGFVAAQLHRVALQHG